MYKVMAFRERIVAWVEPYEPPAETLETIQLTAGIILELYLDCSFIQAITEIAVDSIIKFWPIELVIVVSD